MNSIITKPDHEIYLDHAAMTPPLPCALEAYRNAPFGNPSSEHAAGNRARRALEQARETIAECLDCDIGEVYFVSTATEGAALALNSLRRMEYDVIYSPLEHHAVSYNAWPYEKRERVAYARMLGQNETGELFSAPTLLKSYNRWLCDATAAVGHIPVSFRSLGCDYLLADAIKFSGVPGAAFLIAKHGAPLSPMIRGGGQELGMRSGTENLPAICAMAAALEWQHEHGAENTRYLEKLWRIMFNRLLEVTGCRVNTPLEKPHLPHILNVSFDGVEGRALVLFLSQMGVMVSAGAACSNGLNEPSHVLMAMFNDEARARSAIRISFSHENTEAEVHEAASKIGECVEYLRSLGV